jgi:hypothetical protein
MAPERLSTRLRRVPTALRRQAIPLGDLGALRGPLLRTTAIRLGLLAALLVLAAVALWRASRLEARTLTFVPRDTSAVLVVDQSKSVYLVGYRAIGAIIRRFADADAPVGLVMFSDTAYELLPPGSHGGELRPLLRYYTPLGGRGGSELDPDTHFPANPWDNTFSGGTKVSSGIDLARRILERDRVRHGTILLVSDLDTVDSDLPTLARSLATLQRDPKIDLRVFALQPSPLPLAFFRRFLSKKDFVSPASVETDHRVEGKQRLEAASPTWLVVPGLLLILLLAANELFCSRVELRRPQEASA